MSINIDNAFVVLGALALGLLLLPWQGQLARGTRIACGALLVLLAGVALFTGALSVSA